MYKLTHPNGFDFYSGTINYRDAIGTILRVTDFDPPEIGPCGKGLHASKTPNDCFVGAKIPCAAFRVKGIQPIANDKLKTRYQALKILEEIENLDSLFGWKYSEAINPIHPFKIKPPKISNGHIQLLKEWTSVRASVRASVGDSMGASVRASVWASVGDSMGAGASVRASVWDSVWASVRDSVWDSVRASSVRASMWDSMWDSVWAYVGSLFPSIKKWKYCKHKKGEYPYQSAMDLWKQGLIPSFDGKLWRLHNKKKILWEGKLDV